MQSLKPQILPYTKKGLFATKMNEGITQIGAKVGGLWSSLSSGITSGLLSRSLGVNAEDVERMQASSPATLKESSQSLGAGTNISSGNVISSTQQPTLERRITTAKMKQLAEDTVAADRDGKNAPTLIDEELETLFAGFQKSRENQKQTEDTKLDQSEAEEKAKRLRREEMKVRALNRNGRVDYSIQESMLGTSPLSTLVSHLSYWVRSLILPRYLYTEFC